MEVTWDTKNQAPRSWWQEGPQQNQAYKNRIPATFTFCHLCRFQKCFTETRLVFAIIIKILYLPIPTSRTMWELHLREMQWWAIPWTTPSKYREWCHWKVFGAGLTAATIWRQHLANNISMKRLIQEQWRKYNNATNCSICAKPFQVNRYKSLWPQSFDRWI